MFIGFRVYFFLLLMSCGLTLSASDENIDFDTLDNNIKNNDRLVFANLAGYLGADRLKALGVATPEDLRALIINLEIAQNKSDILENPVEGPIEVFNIEDPSNRSEHGKCFWPLRTAKYVLLVSTLALVVYDLYVYLENEETQKRIEEKTQWLNDNITVLLNETSFLNQSFVNQTVNRTVEVICRTPEVITEIYNMASEIKETIGSNGNSPVDLSYYLTQPISDAIAAVGQAATSNITNAINGMLNTYEGSVDYCSELMTTNLTKIGELTSELIFKGTYSSPWQNLGVCDDSSGGSTYYPCQ